MCDRLNQPTSRPGASATQHLIKEITKLINKYIIIYVYADIQ